MIAPTTTLTPQGAQYTGYAGDYWQFNSQGELVRVHRHYRKTMLTPTRTQCPVSTDRLENYRRTTIKGENGATRTIEDRYQHLDNPNQAQPTLWKGETVFRLKKGTTLPDTLQQQLAARQQQSQQKEIATSRVTPQVIQYKPQRRITGKQPPQALQQQQTETTGTGQGIPHPSELQPGGDYWYREGPYWKRVHVQPRTAYYIPEQTDDGPDISKLSAYRLTKIRPTAGGSIKLVQDEWATEQSKTHDTWTNFEEQEQRPAQLARAAQAPKQPTPQELLEHNVTHLPYRSWCPTCAQARSRANNRPKQQSTMPIKQLDFAYLKGFDDSKVRPILTAIDIQSGMMMALQLSERQRLFDYAVLQLQQFLVERGRTTHVILQSDQEDYLVALTKAVANTMGNITTRTSPAYSSQSQGGVERAHRALFGQIRTLRAQVFQNYNRTIAMKHPIMPWIVRHSAYIVKIRHTRKRIHKLLQQMAQRATHSTV